MRLYLVSADVIPVRSYGSWYDEELVLFCRNSECRSVCILVRDFFPSMLIEAKGRRIEALETLADTVNVALANKKGSNAIVSTSVEKRIPLAFFSYPVREQDVWRLQYRSSSHKNRVLKQLDGETVHHTDQQWWLQFLYVNKLSACTWIEVEDRRVTPQSSWQSTNCDLRYALRWAEGCVKPSEDQGLHLMRVCVADGARTSSFWIGREGSSEDVVMEAFDPRMDMRDMDVLVYCLDAGQELPDMHEHTTGRVRDLTDQDNQWQHGQATRNKPGIHMVNVADMLAKTQVKPKMDEFTLNCAASHPELWGDRPVPEGMDYHEDISVHQLARVRFMVQLMRRRGEIGSLATTASVTPVANFSSIVTSGQTERLFNLIAYAAHTDGFFINRDRLENGKHSYALADASFNSFPLPDNSHVIRPPPQKYRAPDDIDPSDTLSKKRGLERDAMTSGRIDSMFRAKAAKTTCDTTAPSQPHEQAMADYDAQGDEEMVWGGVAPVQSDGPTDLGGLGNKAFQGAIVHQPAPGMYFREFIGSLDFSSLYPSIMWGFGICLSLIVSREDLPRMQDDPLFRHRLMYVPIGRDGRCCVFVSGRRGPPNEKNEWVYEDRPKCLFPEVIRKLLQFRAMAKSQMKKHAAGSPMYALWDDRQKTAKISANALYGAVGSETRFPSLLPLPAGVTALGRFMNWSVVHLIQSRYGLQLVYGDTDSVMMKRPDGDPDAVMTSQDMTERCAMFNRISFDCQVLYPLPNSLAFEGIRWPFIMFPTRKTYVYVDQEEGKPFAPLEDYTIKGLAGVTRARCRFVHDLTHGTVIRMLQRVSDEELCEYLRHMFGSHPQPDKYSDVPIHMRPLEDMAVSITVKDEYKNKNVPMVRIGREMMRMGVRPVPGSRVTFYYARPVDPADPNPRLFPLVRRNGVLCDGDCLPDPHWAYYLRTQSLGSLRQILCMRPGISEKALIERAVRAISHLRVRQSMERLGFSAAATSSSAAGSSSSVLSVPQ